MEEDAVVDTAPNTTPDDDLSP
jgi:hypothetical protein